MTLNINIRISHDGQGQPCGITAKDLLRSEQRTKQVIMANTQETVTALNEAIEQIKKVKLESIAQRESVDRLTAKVAELEALIAAGATPQEVSDKVGELKAELQTLDDVVADAV